MSRTPRTLQRTPNKDNAVSTHFYALHFVVSLDYGIVSPRAAHFKELADCISQRQVAHEVPEFFSAARSIWTKISRELR